VHGENDGLPGLVVDRYDQTWVVKLDTAAWLPHLPPVVAALVDVAGAAGPEPERVVVRMSRRARSVAGPGAPVDGTVVEGSPLDGPVPFLENGLAFEAEVARGQKTGHFLDQRPNRARVGALAAGARVLDVFSCTGGFTVHAAAGGADSVHSIDASPHAIEAVARHLDLNRQRPEVARCRATSATGDAFTLLGEVASQGRRFDLVIVDPPSFAAKQADVDRAVATYGHLTRLALGVLASGGVLVQSSCSSRVPADAFYRHIMLTAREAGRPLDPIERTGHAPDHPIGFPNGAYLKTLFARAS
jgi:23S rRNA (cytosine1962-C5)-methyltransferase